MAYVASRKNLDNPVLLLFPIPLYTNSRVYYEEDLEALGFGKVLDDIEEEARRHILDHATTLANVQPELAFHFVLKFRHILKRIKMADLGKWVSLALDLYDSQGLNAAREFVLGLDTHPIFVRHWGKGVALHDVYGILLNYLHGLGKREVALKSDASHYTDVATIYLPERIALCPERNPNFLLYKVMVTHKFAQLKLGTYRLDLNKAEGLEKTLKERYGLPVPPNLPSALSRFLHLFPDPGAARDLFLLGDTVRIESWMGDHYPGLYRELRKLKKQLGLKREKLKILPPRTQVMEMLIYWWLTDTPMSSGDGLMVSVAEKMKGSLLTLRDEGRSVEDVAETVATLYGMMGELSGPYEAVEGVPYIGELRPEEAEAGRRRKRESTRLKFRQELARLLGDLLEQTEVRVEASAKEPAPDGPKTPQQQEVPSQLSVDGNPVPVPEGMQRIIEEILEDLGCIPSSYLAVTDEMSGHRFRPLCRVAAEDEILPQQAQGTGYVFPQEGENIHAIDEWDYRRQGYRKRWALLRESTAPSGVLDFADETLKRYHGMVLRIKRQFERIRMGQTTLRRQKDGDEIDLDAAVEAVTDLHAGLSPSDDVFTRLARDKRDIATAFLIDLSGSTSGWINEVARASLLILSEAMQVLQDRFAIYGFSGRTRKRCELFRVKGIYEPYGETVKRRIANLRALEYTRLGPPIRHLTNLLTQVEARTRLLITLSDGKPDDYDGYNGDYGIEDTRQALIEAKMLGIHPFCITIDKAEHSYLSRMYGAVNYVFIDDLSKLPVKVPEIYRKLTT